MNNSVIRSGFKATVHVGAVTDADDTHHSGLVEDAKDDAVVAHANPQRALRPAEATRACGPRLVAERGHAIHNAGADRSREPLQAPYLPREQPRHGSVSRRTLAIADLLDQILEWDPVGIGRLGWYVARFASIQPVLSPLDHALACR